jgi:hypothetical protein
MSAGGVPADAAASAVRVDIRRGDPTPEELAAVVAVVTEAYTTEAAAASPKRAARLRVAGVGASAARTPPPRDRLGPLRG